MHPEWCSKHPWGSQLTLVDLSPILHWRGTRSVMILKISLHFVQCCCDFPNCTFLIKYRLFYYSNPTNTDIIGFMNNIKDISSFKRSTPDHDIKYPSSLLATAGFDHRIFLWHPKTGDIYKEYDHKGSQVNALKFSDNGCLLAVTGYEVLHVYDVHSNSPLTIMSNNLEHGKNITCVGFHKNEETRLVTGTISVMNDTYKSSLALLILHSLGGEDGFCRIWEFPKRNLKHVREIDCSARGVINCLSTQHPLFVAVVGTQQGYILGWQVEDNAIIQLYHKHATSINSIDCFYSESEVKVAAITLSGNLIYNYNNKDTWYDEPCHTRYGLCCVFSPDGKLLATSGADGRIMIFGLEREKVFKLQEFSDTKLRWIWDLEFSNDVGYLFVASSDGMVQMWSLQDKTVRRTYRGHQKTVVTLSLFQQKSSDPQRNARL